MKYCFVGVGSIARKHIANIKKIDNSAIIHAYRTGKSNYSNFDNIDKEIFDFKEIDDNYDAIFITNPTSMHYDTLKNFINKSNCFFIEKPIFSYFKPENDLIEYYNKKTYIAAPLRFSSGVQYAKNIISTKGVPNSIRIISSSYLPDWRPNVDYRKTYSAHMEMGGGVHIDLIHELDYLSYLVGIPKKSFYINKKVSNLDIDSYDISASIHEFNCCVAEIHLDYFGRELKRICELYYNDSTITIDLINNSVNIKYSNSYEQINLNKSDMYFEEMSYFLSFVKDNTMKSINDIYHANQILKIINEGELNS